MNNSWEVAYANPTEIVVAQDCPAGASALSGMYAAAPADSGSVPPGVRGEWRFVSPPGTQIVAARLFGSLQTGFDENWRAYIQTDKGNLRVCSFPVSGDICQSGSGGFPLTGPAVATFDGLGATYLGVGIQCEGASCINGANYPMAFATVHQASVTLEDLSAPVIGTPSGLLTDATTPHAGTVALTTAVSSDLGGGVRRVRLVVDGTPLGGGSLVDATCDFTFRQPCPSTLAPQTLAFDTRAVADGVHSVAVRVEDAGGNTTDTSTWTIRVQNTSSAGPGGPGSGGPPAVDPPIVWVDTDKDGIPDHLDRCSTQLGGANNHGCPLHIDGPVPKRTNVVVPTGKARYHSGHRAVLVPVRSLPWARTILVRVRKGKQAAPARLVRVRANKGMVVMPVPRALRIPTRVEWRPVGEKRWRWQAVPRSGGRR